MLLYSLLNWNRIGPCDVTSKEDLENLVQEITKKEKHLNLLSIHCLPAPRESVSDSI